MQCYVTQRSSSDRKENGRRLCFLLLLSKGRNYSLQSNDFLPLFYRPRPRVDQFVQEVSTLFSAPSFRSTARLFPTQRPPRSVYLCPKFLRNATDVTSPTPSNNQYTKPTQQLFSVFIFRVDVSFTSPQIIFLVIFESIFAKKPLSYRICIFTVTKPFYRKNSEKLAKVSYSTKSVAFPELVSDSCIVLHDSRVKVVEQSRTKYSLQGKEGIGSKQEIKVNYSYSSGNGE